MSWIDDALIETLQDRKDKALELKLSEIDSKNREMNLKNFSHNTNTFYSDKDSIQSVQNKCLAMLSQGVDGDTTSVPAPSGVWKSADVQEDGISPIYIPMTINEFLSLSDSFFQRGSDNFGVKEGYKNAVKAIYLDENSTPSDIANYDISSGWY